MEKIKILKQTRNVHSKYWGCANVGILRGPRIVKNPDFRNCIIYYCKSLLSKVVQYRIFQRIQHLHLALARPPSGGAGSRLDLWPLPLRFADGCL